MSKLKKTTISSGLASAVVAVALMGGPLAAPASAHFSTVVDPGKSISGLFLGETATAVHNYRPLDLNAPTSTNLAPVPGHGTLLFETYTTPAGQSLTAAYALPTKKKGKKKKGKKKKPEPTVVYLSTGSGIWATTGGLFYQSSGQFRSGSSPAEVGKAYGCSFYQKTPSGQRLYDPDPGDGQYCELAFGQTSWFYFSFNDEADLGSSEAPALLAAFSLSMYQIP